METVFRRWLFFARRRSPVNDNRCCECTNSNLYFNRGYAIICGYVRKPWIFQTKRGF